jgi:hypothetical protein
MSMRHGHQSLIIGHYVHGPSLNKVIDVLLAQGPHDGS